MFLLGLALIATLTTVYLYASNRRRLIIMRENEDFLTTFKPLDSPAPITVFAHGHGSCPRVGELYSSPGPVCETQPYRFSEVFEDDSFIDDAYTFFYSHIAMPWIMPTFPVFGYVSAIGSASGLRNYNLGGGEDGSIYARHVVSLIDSNSTDPFVLMGHSRGASTVINALTFLSQRNDWAKRILPRIRAVLLLNPFASAQDAIRHHHLVPRFLQRPLLWLYTNVAYYRSEFDPVNRIRLLPHGITYYVSCATTDAIIPPWSTHGLVIAMQQAGHTVNLIDLNTDAHHFIYAPRSERHRLFQFIRNAIN